MLENPNSVLRRSNIVNPSRYESMHIAAYPATQAFSGSPKSITATTQILSSDTVTG
jgi:hypothetical protein